MCVQPSVEETGMISNRVIWGSSVSFVKIRWIILNISITKLSKRRSLELLKMTYVKRINDGQERILTWTSHDCTYRINATVNFFKRQFKWEGGTLKDDSIDYIKLVWFFLSCECVVFSRNFTSINTLNYDVGICR